MLNFFLSIDMVDIPYAIFNMTTGCIFWFILAIKYINFSKKINIIYHIFIGIIIGYILFKTNFMLEYIGQLFTKNENRAFIFVYFFMFLLSIFQYIILKNKFSLLFSFLIFLFFIVGFFYHKIIVYNSIPSIKYNIEEKLDIISTEQNKLLYCKAKKYICFTEKNIQSIDDYYQKDKNFKTNYKTIINNDLNLINKFQYQKNHKNYQNFSVNGSTLYYFNFNAKKQNLLVLVSNKSFPEEHIVLKYYFFFMSSFIFIWFSLIISITHLHMKKHIK